MGRQVTPLQYLPRQHTPNMRSLGRMPLLTTRRLITVTKYVEDILRFDVC
jgi:hypothetical protein